MAFKLLTIVTSVVAAAISIWLLPVLAASHASAMLTITWFVWFGSVLLVSWARPFSPPSMLLLAILGLYVLYPATADVAGNHAGIAGFQYEDGISRALTLILLIQLGTSVGLCLGRLRSPRRLVPLALADETYLIERLVFRLMFVGLASYLAFAVASKERLSLLIAIVGRGSYGAAITGDGTQIGYLSSLRGVVGDALILLFVWILAGRSRRRRSYALLAGASFVLIAGGQRSNLVIPLVGAFLLSTKLARSGEVVRLLKWARRINSARVFILLVVGLVSFSAIIGVARSVPSQRRFTASTLLRSQFGEGADLFTPLAGEMVIVPNKDSYLYGKSYLEAFVFWVPRAIWEDKPQGSMSKLTNEIGGAAGVAVPEYGELYANFGIPGVILGSALLAYSIERLWWKLRRADDLGSCILLVVTIAVILQWVTRGSLTNLVASQFGLIAGAFYIRRALRKLRTSHEKLRTR